MRAPEQANRAQASQEISSPSSPSPEQRTSPSSHPPAERERGGRGGGGGALFVGAGILLSRLIGLVRQKVLAQYLGTSPAAAAFAAALRIPNFLQNLLGEGVLSASFIPVYVRRLQRSQAEADAVAGAVFGLLSFVTALLVAAGVVGAPWLVELLATGLSPEVKAQAVLLVQILFPGTGLLVLSAFCLGVLNSHRRFFLSYAAPVVWNAAIIGAVLLFRKQEDAQFVRSVAYGTVVGCALQLLVQVPSVWRLFGQFRPRLSLKDAGVREVLKSFGPVVLGRGVVQVSGWMDGVYASFISVRAYTLLSQYTQTLSMLPVSLFGMAVSAAELPALSQVAAGASSAEERQQSLQKLSERLSRGLERIAFFVVPSSAAFLLLGDVLAAILFQGGRFSALDTRLSWFILMGSAVGLLASTQGRLVASAFYALQDARTPLKFAVVRVAVGGALALFAVWGAPALLGLPREVGALGVTASSGLAAWLEFALLRSALSRQLPGGKIRAGEGTVGRLWLCAVLAGGAALAAKWALGRAFGVDGSASLWGIEVLLPPRTPAVATGLGLAGLFGIVYLVATYLLGIPQSVALVGRVTARLGRRR